MASLTYLDIAKRTGSDTAIGLVEELNTFAPEIRTLPARPIEGTTFKTSKRLSLPTGAFRGANAGNTPAASRYEQILAQAYFFDTPLVVDEAIVKADGGELGSILSDEASGALEGAAISIGSQFYYGTSADANGFAGLQANISSDLIVSAGGTGGATSTSIYLVWENLKGVHLVAGNGQTIDLSPEGWVKQMVTDTADSTKRFQAYCNNVSGYIGLAFGHKYAAGRIKLVTSAKPGTDALIAEAISKFPLSMRTGLRIFMNRDAALWLQSSRSTTAQPTSRGNPNWAPMPEESNGVPITITDSISTGATAEQS